MPVGVSLDDPPDLGGRHLVLNEVVISSQAPQVDFDMRRACDFIDEDNRMVCDLLGLYFNG
jgi:hypothetical protein